MLQKIKKKIKKNKNKCKTKTIHPSLENISRPGTSPWQYQSDTFVQKILNYVFSLFKLYAIEFTIYNYLKHIDRGFILQFCTTEKNTPAFLILVILITAPVQLNSP